MRPPPWEFDVVIRRHRGTSADMVAANVEAETRRDRRTTQVHSAPDTSREMVFAKFSPVTVHHGMPGIFSLRLLLSFADEYIDATRRDRPLLPISCTRPACLQARMLNIVLTIRRRCPARNRRTRLSQYCMGVDGSSPNLTRARVVCQKKFE